jgi:microcystin-dependent protein
MTQASDLGAITNQLAALYRARVNINVQAVVTQHYGATEPAVLYPNMIWFDSGTGSVKMRDPTNSSWAVVGSIGPPFKWTSVDIPTTAFTTGDIKMTYKVTPDSGWVMMNDGSIGDASSGASNRANPDTQDLFTLLWTNISDTWCKLYVASSTTPSGRGASAAADWAAHRHIAIPKVLGRAIGSAGWGSGLTNLALGAIWGAESVALGVNNMPTHLHTMSSHTHGPGSLGTDSQGDHTHTTPQGLGSQSPSGVYAFVQDPGQAGNYRLISTNTGANGAHIHSVTSGLTGAGGSGNTGSAGSGDAHSNVQPSSYANVMIKL